MDNPYRWDRDVPTHVVPRPAIRSAVLDVVRRGVAMKLVGGRGMGKSVLLRQVESALAGDPATRVLYVPGPPEEATTAACVHDLAARLGLEQLPRASLDVLMESLEAGGVHRLVLLLDEIDQYVLLDGSGHIAQRWTNALETLRKTRNDQFTVVVAGGLGLLHVTHELGSGLLSRAESMVLEPFDLDALGELARPFADDGRPLDATSLATLAALSGGNPALATFGLGHLWDHRDAREEALRALFGAFPEQHRDFVRALRASVSRRGMLRAPERVLALVRSSSTGVSQRDLTAVSAQEKTWVDPGEVIDLLRAAGLVHLRGSALSDPVDLRAIPSILNLPEHPAAGVDPVERLVKDVASILGQLHRFSRDFWKGNDLLEEQAFSSMLAVGMRLLGWRAVDREVVQAAGFLDVRVEVEREGGARGHVIIEMKIWPRHDYDKIQDQIDAYRVADTLHGIAVTIGTRAVAGWARDYRDRCLASETVTELPTPPDLVGHWRVERRDSNGAMFQTDHYLVQMPKRV